MSRGAVLKSVLAVWIALWLFFLAREDKDGQYASLNYMYTHSASENARYVVGADLYDFLILCGKTMPPGSTYRLDGFGNFSIDAVRARYILWPLRSVEKDADFIAVYGRTDASYPGYSWRAGGGGMNCVILEREGGKR